MSFTKHAVLGESGQVLTLQMKNDDFRLSPTAVSKVGFLSDKARKCQFYPLVHSAIVSFTLSVTFNVSRGSFFSESVKTASIKRFFSCDIVFQLNIAIRVHQSIGLL